METIWLLGFILLLGLNLAQWFILYQLIKQRGRLLLRLDDLELRLEEIDQATNLTQNSIANSNIYTSEIPVGTLLNFQLPDLDGRAVALKDFRGKKVLLVFWDSQSNVCKTISPELAKIQSEFHNSKSQLLLITKQTPELNEQLMQASGLKGPVLLITSTSDMKMFHNLESPSAYLVDEEGHIISPLAIGANQVLRLAREAISLGAKTGDVRQRALSKSKIEREGLKAGTPAPSFTLPTISGQSVSLKEYRGRQVLLVFTSPHCAPCDYLAPYLVRFQEQILDYRLAILMIGRGDAAENRQKAETYGFQFPLALQKHWEISKLYGIFSTPVAFLINESGVIASKVAKGTDEVLALAEEGLAIEQELHHEPIV